MAAPSAASAEGRNLDNTNEVLKVAGSSNVKSLAGALAKRIREGGSVKAVALGAPSVNQAVKALAIARTYLEGDKLDLAISPEFIHIPGKNSEEPQRSALRFHVTSATRGDGKETIEEDGHLKVASKTVSLSAAGAIAKRIRDDKPCCLTCMGPESVNQGTKSVAIARTYLEEDNMDVLFKPRFTHIALSNGETKSAVELVVTKKEE